MLSCGSTNPSPTKAKLCRDSNSSGCSFVSATSYQMCHQLVTSHSATLNSGTMISLL